MKVLITGANGQLGQELQRVLRSGQTELGAVSPALAQADVTAIDLDVLDIADLPATLRYLDGHAPDVVFNCAAMTNVNGCESDPDTAFRANALGPRNLAIACERVGAKLIHVSTDYVFSGDGDKPYREWDLCQPQSVYGKSKYLGEQYVMQFCSRYAIVRTAWLYGYVGKNFVKTILHTARTQGVLRVVNDQWGNPTNAADLAHHLIKIAATQEYGVYHCTGEGICTWFDFAASIVDMAGIPCTVAPCTTGEYPTPAKRPAYSALENQMLSCTVGNEMRPWQEALRCYIDRLPEFAGSAR